jgi:hypothetical protein
VENYGGEASSSARWRTRVLSPRRLTPCWSCR